MDFAEEIEKFVMNSEEPVLQRNSTRILGWLKTKDPLAYIRLLQCTKSSRILMILNKR
jgi:hypothetical protein